MKFEYKKQLKEFYLPKSKPEIKKIPEFNYIVISGEGNPNDFEFSEAVEALYALSYTIKMAPKKGIDIPGYFDYTVFPLEGVWDLTDEGKILNENKNVKEIKDYFKYDVMIQQPSFVTKDLVDEMKSIAFKKKKLDKILEIEFINGEEELMCQMMHIGPYDDEPKSFNMMEDYVKENNYLRVKKTHREIYLSDPRKVVPEKMKTVLKFEVKRND